MEVIITSWTRTWAAIGYELTAVISFKSGGGFLVFFFHFIFWSFKVPTNMIFLITRNKVKTGISQ